MSKVNLELIAKEYESTRKYHTGYLQSGEEIRYYNKFSETKIRNLITELHEMVLEDEKQEIPFFNKDSVSADGSHLFDFTYFLIIKYFTDLGKEFKDGYENNIRTFSMLVDLEMFQDIINNIMPLEEIGKVTERIMERIEVSQQVERMQSLFDNPLEQ